jgi:hypothetical protein
MELTFLKAYFASFLGCFTAIVIVFLVVGLITFFVVQAVLPGIICQYAPWTCSSSSSHSSSSLPSENLN